MMPVHNDLFVANAFAIHHIIDVDTLSAHTLLFVLGCMPQVGTFVNEF